MWLFIPGASTSFPSVPEEAGSISDWSWHAEVLARSVWWRGKPSPSPTWSKRCAKVSWLQRLCGAMPEPSAAESGAASWMASLAASRASLTASPASASARKTSATSGARRGASLCNRAPGSPSSRMSAACSPRAAPSGCGETFADWASRLRLDSSRRQRLARAINASACSSSRWPAMRCGDGATKSLPRPGTPTGGRIETAVANWSTPRASDAEKGGPNQVFISGGTPLPAQAVQWATPRSEMARALGDPKHITPRRGSGNIEDQVLRWPTPTSLSFGNSHQPGNSRSYNRTMELASSLLGPETSTVGERSLPERRSLNPHFVEWLMGWPPGWTMLASNGSACSATALCRWKLLMRSALSQLGSPPPAPRPQLSFLI